MDQTNPLAAFLAANSPSQETSEGTETETVATPTATETTEEEQSPTVDYAALLRQAQQETETYKRRLAGSQRKIQTEVEAKKALVQRLAQLEDQQAATVIAQLPEEHQQLAKIAYDAEKGRREATLKLADNEELLDVVGKQAAVIQSALLHQIPLERLMRFNTAEGMQEYINSILEDREEAAKKQDTPTKTPNKAEVKQQRRANQADNFEGGNIPLAEKAPDDYTEAREFIRRVVGKLQR